MAYTYQRLSTDFKDDIINEEVNEKRKYRMVQNGDGTVSFEDVTDYLKKGSLFGGTNINDTNMEINKINSELKNNIYGKSIDVRYVDTALAGDNTTTKVVYIVISKVAYNESMGSMQDSLINSYELNESAQSFKIDLEPKQMYRFTLDISGIVNTYKSSGAEKVIFVQLTNVSSRMPRVAQLSINVGGENSENMIDIFVYNFSDKVYKNFTFWKLFRYHAIVYKKLEALRD